MGVPHNTVNKWLNPSYENTNMPAFIITEHPNAKEIVEYFAKQIDCVLIGNEKLNKPKEYSEEALMKYLFQLGNALADNKVTKSLINNIIEELITLREQLTEERHMY